MSDESRSPLLPVAHAQQFGRIVFHCALVGFVAGVGAIIFDASVTVLSQLALGGLAGFHPPRALGDHAFFHLDEPAFRPWVLALLPVLGGLVGGALVRAFAPDAEGHGTDAAIDAYHHRKGRIHPRIPIIKTLASVITLGTGGSAGREGPIAQIGAGLGSIIADGLRLTAKERRLLMIAGLAAGIGAVFRAPLAAAIFSAELLYREMDMEFEAIVPSVISSIVSYSVFTMVMGSGALFETPPFSFESPFELIPYTFLALVVAVGAFAFVNVFYLTHDTFRALNIHPVAKPVLGGALAGSFAFFLPEALGQGYGVVQQAFTGEVGLGMLLAVFVGKTLTTAFTVGSGQSGGVFGPAIVTGGVLAGAVGVVMEVLLPGISPPQGAFVVVGMAGFFAGAANAPISTIIMVSEITGNYLLLVPSMWVCVIAFMLVRRSSLYSKQLARRTDSPAHLGEMMGEILERITVGVALKVDERDPVVTVAADAPLVALREAFSATHHACFPVVDREGRLVGVVDDQALRQAICDDAVREVLVAADLLEPAPLLVASESLHSAMDKMVSSGLEELVVVAADDPRRVVGMLSRRDLVEAYDHQIRIDQDRLEHPTNEVGPLRSAFRDWSRFANGREASERYWVRFRLWSFYKKSPPPSEGGGGGGGSEGGEEEPTVKPP